MKIRNQNPDFFYYTYTIERYKSMFKEIDEVNEILKEKLSSIMFEQFTPFTVEKIQRIFKETSTEVTPQHLVLEDIENFDSAVKLQYNLQGKQYSMIIDRKV